jgi:DNA topoisomerase-1
MLDRYDRADVTKSREAALAAGLRYVVPHVDPGFSRKRRGKSFLYLDERGRRIARPETLARIRRIVIPPAWEDVWISADPIGHVQAAGRDARGRLQYRYHEQWRAARDGAKYAKLADFCKALPALRKRLQKDLGCACICKASVAATVIALLERGHLRVGNDEYTRENGTYGATTLENRHLRLRGARIELGYRGKSGIQRKIEIKDPVLAHVIAKVKALPGKRLFQYVGDDGRPHPITSNDVNAYLRETIGDEFSAKDFRTWAASVWCALRLAVTEVPAAKTAQKKAVREVICEVAARLGHTPTVCRKSYVHPRVIEVWADGTLARTFPARLRASAARGVDVDDLRAAEKWIVQLFEAEPALVAQGAAAMAA